MTSPKSLAYFDKILYTEAMNRRKRVPSFTIKNKSPIIAQRCGHPRQQHWKRNAIPLSSTTYGPQHTHTGSCRLSRWRKIGDRILYTVLTAFAGEWVGHISKKASRNIEAQHWLSRWRSGICLPVMWWCGYTVRWEIHCDTSSYNKPDQKMNHRYAQVYRYRQWTTIRSILPREEIVSEQWMVITVFRIEDRPPRCGASGANTCRVCVSAIIFYSGRDSSLRCMLILYCGLILHKFGDTIRMFMNKQNDGSSILQHAFISIESETRLDNRVRVEPSSRISINKINYTMSPAMPETIYFCAGWWQDYIDYELYQHGSMLDQFYKIRRSTIFTFYTKADGQSDAETSSAGQTTGFYARSSGKTVNLQPTFNLQ